MRSTPNSGNILNLGQTSATNTIEDDAFFEGLPVLVQEVTDKLSHLLDLEAESIAVGDLPFNPPASQGIASVAEADPQVETVLFMLQPMIRVLPLLRDNYDFFLDARAIAY